MSAYHLLHPAEVNPKTGTMSVDDTSFVIISESRINYWITLGEELIARTGEDRVVILTHRGPHFTQNDRDGFDSRYSAVYRLKQIQEEIKAKSNKL